MDPTTSTKYNNEGYSTNKKIENCEKPSCMNIKPFIDNRYIYNIQILCLIRKWDFPKYDYVTNMVPGRYGNTVLHIAICSTMIYKSIGHGGKKNVAKKEAAQKMYEQIINLSKDEIDNILHCKHKIPEIKFDSKETLEISTSPDILKIVKELFGRLHNNPFLKNLKKIDSFENISAVDMLNAITEEEEDLSLKYFVREQIPDVGIIAEINIIYGMVFVGIGLTIAQAKESAALAALNYIKLMS